MSSKNTKPATAKGAKKDTNIDPLNPTGSVTPDPVGKDLSEASNTTPVVPPKPTNAKHDPVAEIAKKLKVSELWENDKGEYFTSLNLAMVSVGNDAEKLKKHSNLL